MTSAPGVKFIRPGRLPTLITLAALALLVGLGHWQLERLEWKQEIIAKISERTAAPPVLAPDYLSSDYLDMEYRRVKAGGIYLHDLEVAVYALGPRGAPGYHIFTPFEMLDGRGTVLVNRGWVPEDLKLASDRVAGLSESNKRVDGVLRIATRPNDFTPDNSPAEDKWFWPDLRAIAEARGLERLAGYVIAASPNPDAPAPPYGGATRLQIKNDHLGYALTWFGLALVLIVVFAAYHLRRPEQN